MKCSVIGCSNSRLTNPEKYFFRCPRGPEERRKRWVEPTGKRAAHFVICEDHFDLDTDVDYYSVGNGKPCLHKSTYPHRNLTQPEMALQAQLDSVNWKCFVRSCENKRLMENKNVVFFPVPEGLQGQRWRSAVLGENGSNDSSVGELEFCCEDHFDNAKDFDRKFNFGTGSSFVYVIKDGIVPSLNLNDSKLGILNEVKLSRLSDSCAHPRMLLNNRITYLYGSKFPLLMEKLRTADNVSFVAVKEEQIELDKSSVIKTEPMDTGYEYEINNEIVIKREHSCSTDTNPLELKPECKYQSDSDSESVDSDTSDTTFKASLESTDDDSFEPYTSEDSIESESVDDNADTDLDLNSGERFECCHCKLLVRNLDTHVKRAHWNFSKNVNRTRCGLCSEKFARKQDLRNHQSKVHRGNAYACDICGSLARTHQNIRVHILQVHSHEREFLCQQCGKSYKFIKNLRRHVQIAHIGVVRERSHACDQCDKKFLSEHHTRKHVNSVHLNLRPYKCNVDGCNKAFKQPIHLKFHHAQVHAKQNNFTCVVCDKKFSLKSNLTAHLKNVHKN